MVVQQLRQEITTVAPPVFRSLPRHCVTTAAITTTLLVENLADAIENGTQDQHAEALIGELNSRFEKCQQLLNSIAGKINSKAMTVEGQKHKLEVTNTKFGM